jgi:hypothetical protein
MGTRNLTCVIKGGEFRVAQYGQWDGYPEAAGRDILAFLNTPGYIEKLRSRVDECQLFTEAQWSQRMEDEGIGTSIVVGSEQERNYKEKFWMVDRDLGRKVLNAIVTTTGPLPLMDSRTFAQDSLFCEWAYVVDLDRNVLEVYVGFNHDSNANAGVFASLPPKEYESYYAVSLVKSYTFDNLPTVEVMKEECDPEESEDD